MRIEVLKDIEVRNMISRNEIDLILDIRNNEYYIKGHLPGAINIPMNEIPDYMEFINNFKNKTILIYCGIGKQSINAGNVLILNGFNKIYSLDNGIKGYKFALEK